MSNYIVSLSGGKDSTAMLHLMLEKGINIHSAIFFDTGWEFPQMIDHIGLIEKKTGIKVVVLKPPRDFEYLMFHHKVVARWGENKGKVHRIGYGWPHATRRWCTREKITAIDKYIKSIPEPVSCIGIAADETKRIRRDGKQYPLVEYGVTETDCLKYCKYLGYHWNGLYDIFSRVSCFCCPLLGIESLRLLRIHYPDLWGKIVEMNKRKPVHDFGFKDYPDLSPFEDKLDLITARLAAKGRQRTFFDD